MTPHEGRGALAARDTDAAFRNGLKYTVPGMALATLVGVILNLILPRESKGLAVDSPDFRGEMAEEAAGYRVTVTRAARERSRARQRRPRAARNARSGAASVARVIR